jgi:methanogenic corrinoid protein MtbC1
MSDTDDLDLNSLSDEDLVAQMHDDLYDGLADEIAEGTQILLDRKWDAQKVLSDALVEGMRIVGIDFRDGILFVPIGKNLVAMMLEGAGFEVFDLGINTDVDGYLSALAEHQPDILGMSALLTTTMPYMKVVIDTMKERGLRNDYIVLVGGAPLNEEFGTAIGADAYCRDAAVAAETAKTLVAKRRAAA